MQRSNLRQRDLRQSDFYGLWRRMQRGDRRPGQSVLRTALGCAAAAGLCVAGWAGLSAHTARLQARRAEVLAQCDARQAEYRAAVETLQAAQTADALAAYAGDLTDLLADYPALTADLLQEIESTGGDSVTTRFTAYDAADGVLTCDAWSAQVIDIPAYIRALENCEALSSVEYTGYRRDDNGSYRLALRCVLAPRQGAAS